MTLRFNKQKNMISWLTKAICIYFLSIPFDFIPIGSFGSISKAVVFFPVLVIVLNLHRIKLSGNELAIIIFFLLVSFFSSIISIHSSAINNWFSLFQNLSVIALLICFSYNDIEYNAIETSILFSGIILIILFFVFNYSGETGRQGISLMGVEQNFNYLCGYLLLPQAICLKRASQQRNKVFYYVVLTCMIVVVFLSGSRGGLLASIGIVGVYLIMYLHNKSVVLSSKILYIFSFAILSISLVMIFERIVPDELKPRYFVQTILSDKGSNRILIWDSLLKSYSQFNFIDKLFGIGIGTSRFYSYNGTYAAHNVFLAYLLECGLVGVLTYIGLLIRLGRLSIKKQCYSQFAALVGFIIMSMTTTFTNFKPMWVLLFYMIVSINRQEVIANTDSYRE